MGLESSQGLCHEIKAASGPSAQTWENVLCFARSQRGSKAGGNVWVLLHVLHRSFMLFQLCFHSQAAALSEDC